MKIFLGAAVVLFFFSSCAPRTRVEMVNPAGAGAVDTMYVRKAIIQKN